MLRKAFLPAALLASLLIGGCDGGVDADLKAPVADVQKNAAKLSADELKKRLDELEKRTEALKKDVGSKEPTDEQMQQLTKYLEVGGIYAAEMVRKKSN